MIEQLKAEGVQAQGGVRGSGIEGSRARVAARVQAQGGARGSGIEGSRE